MTTRTSSLATAPSLRISGLIGRVFTMLAFHRERQSLARLDDAMLRDIGVSREEAQREAARPIWDAPGRWFQ